MFPTTAVPTAKGTTTITTADNLARAVTTACHKISGIKLGLGHWWLEKPPPHQVRIGIAMN
jgi:hypothetical protein